MLHTDGKSGVAHKDDKFWSQAGIFIQQQLNTSHYCTGVYVTDCKIDLIGSSCGTKAFDRFAKQFATPAIAEQHFSKIFSHTSMLTTPVNSPVCTVALPTPVTELSVTTASVLSFTDITSLPPTPVLCYNQSCGHFQVHVVRSVQHHHRKN